MRLFWGMSIYSSVTYDSLYLVVFNLLIGKYAPKMGHVSEKGEGGCDAVRQFSHIAGEF